MVLTINKKIKMSKEETDKFFVCFFYVFKGLLSLKKFSRLNNLV